MTPLALHTRRNQSRALYQQEPPIIIPQHFHEASLIPEALHVGRPDKGPSEFASYNEVRMIQEPSISGESLSEEISDEPGISLS
jgi:hypothetical protein